MYLNTIKSNKAVIYNNVSVGVFETGFEGGERVNIVNVLWKRVATQDLMVVK